MRTKIQMWGNSLGVRIPKPFAEEAGLREQSEVDLSLVRGSLVVKPAPPAWSLERLLAAVSKRNLHGKELAGPAAGREVW